jgi:hypothetical protein
MSIQNNSSIFSSSGSGSFQNTFAYLLEDTLSYSVINTANGIYSLRAYYTIKDQTYINKSLACIGTLISPIHTVPVADVYDQNGANFTTLYADYNGSLYTDANNSPFSINTSITTTTYYVSRWYDQSSKNNHATQTNATLRPKLILDTTNTYCLDFTINIYNNFPYFNIPSGTIPMQQSYTISFYISNIQSSYAGICGAGSPTTLTGINDISIQNNLNTTRDVINSWDNQSHSGFIQYICLNIPYSNYANNQAILNLVIRSSISDALHINDPNSVAVLNFQQSNSGGGTIIPFYIIPQNPNDIQINATKFKNLFTQDDNGNILPGSVATQNFINILINQGFSSLINAYYIDSNNTNDLYTQLINKYYDNFGDNVLAINISLDKLVNIIFTKSVEESYFKYFKYNNSYYFAQFEKSLAQALGAITGVSTDTNLIFINVHNISESGGTLIYFYYTSPINQNSYDSDSNATQLFNNIQSLFQQDSTGNVTPGQPAKQQLIDALIANGFPSNINVYYNEQFTGTGEVISPVLPYNNTLYYVNDNGTYTINSAISRSISNPTPQLPQYINITYDATQTSNTLFYSPSQYDNLYNSVYRVGWNGQNTRGYIGKNTSNQYLNGYLYDLSIFTSMLDTPDIYTLQSFVKKSSTPVYNSLIN